MLANHLVENTMTEFAINGQAVKGSWKKYLGWITVSLLVAFLINNFLNIYFGFEGALSLFSGFSLTGTVTLLIYIAFTVIGMWYVNKTINESYREQAKKLHDFNVYFLRGCFFAVLFIGCIDFLLALLRSIDVLKLLVGEPTSRALGLGNVVGPFIHIPLVVLGFIIAKFTKTLGWTWLALLIVFAELVIVISRYLFSYEQSFMADLVRYWYAALFLFASAYTLYDEGHVRVDVVYAGLSDKVKAYVNAWGSYLLGVVTTVVIVVIGFNGKTSIINSPLLVFEITNQGINGMFIKYQMAMFLGIFGATMMVQFIVQFFDSIADINGEPGKRDTSIQLGH